MIDGVSTRCFQGENKGRDLLQGHGAQDVPNLALGQQVPMTVVLPLRAPDDGAVLEDVGQFKTVPLQRPQGRLQGPTRSNGVGNTGIAHACEGLGGEGGDLRFAI